MKKAVWLACMLALQARAQGWPERCELARDVLRQQAPVPFVELDKMPDWATRPPPRADWFVLTTHARGITPSVAAERVIRSSRNKIRRLLLEHLQPALGPQGAEDAIGVLWPRPELVQVAVYPDHELGGSSKFATACWRAPVRDSVGKLDPAVQGRVEWVLLRPLVRWQRVEKEPDWVAEVPPRQGYYRVAMLYEERDPPHAKNLVHRKAREHLQAHLYQLLQPVLRDERAKSAIEVGMGRMAAARRAYHRREPQSVPQMRRVVAWCLWEVPLRHVVDASPEVERLAVRAALAQHAADSDG